MHDYVIKNIEKGIERQKEIDAKVANTDNLIFKSIEIKRNKYIEDQAKNKEREENEKKKIVEEKKKKQVEMELKKLKEKYVKVLYSILNLLG